MGESTSVHKDVHTCMYMYMYAPTFDMQSVELAYLQYIHVHTEGINTYNVHVHTCMCTL